MWSKLKSILGGITDILTIGRSRGWWSRGHGSAFVTPLEDSPEER
jgi:hypothetical protein